MEKLLTSIYWFIQSLFGWKPYPDDGVVLRLPTSEEDGPIENFLPTEDILAYVLDNDASIYVAKGHEKMVEKKLDAEIDGDIWQFKEDGEPAKRRLTVYESIQMSTMSVIKWIYFDGFECKLIPAGAWVKLYKRERGWNSWKYKVIMLFKTTEESTWCVRSSRRRCRTVWDEYTGEYKRRRNGKWVTVRETHRIGACAD